MNKIYPL